MRELGSVIRYRVSALGHSMSVRSVTSIEVTSQSARAPVTELLEGQAGVTNVSHGLDVDAMPRQPAVTFGEVTTIEVT
jgi:hypothetical protein